MVRITPHPPPLLLLLGLVVFLKLLHARSSSARVAPSPSRTEVSLAPALEEHRIPTNDRVPTPCNFANGIRRTSIRTWRVRRSLVDCALEQQASVVKWVQFTPVESAGRVTGIRLLYTQHSPLLRRIGLLPNDVLLRVNGIGVADPTPCVEPYARLQLRQRLRLLIQRGNQQLEMSYVIE